MSSTINTTTRGQGQFGYAPNRNEFSSSVEDYSFQGPGNTETSSVSSVSEPSLQEGHVQGHRVSLASADLAKLLTGFGKGQHALSYDTCAGGRSAGDMRQRLNETIYELMVARAAAMESASTGEALRLSTSETPFVDPPVTANEAVNAFVSERTARAEEGGEIYYDQYQKDDEDNKDGSWQTSAAWRRGLLVLILTLLLVTLFHTAAFIFLLQSSEVFEHPYACKSRNCLKLSEWILEGLDNKTNPCDNFYNFTCGKYRKNPHIKRGGYLRIHDGVPFEYISNEALGRLLHRVHGYPLDQILPFYHSCINEDERNRVGFQPFINLLFELKLMDPVKSGKMNIGRTIIRIFRRVYKRVFINVYSSRENYIVLTLAAPDREYTLLKDQADYVASIRTTFQLFKTALNIVADDEIETIVYLLTHFIAELVHIQSKRSMLLFGFPDKMDTFAPKPAKLHPNYIPSKKGFFEFGSLVAALFSHQRHFKNVTIFFNYVQSILKQEDRLHILLLEEFLNDTPYYVILRYFQWTLIKHFAVDLTTNVYDAMIPVFRDMGFTPDERCFRSMFSRLHVLAALRFSKELKNTPFLNARVSEILDTVGSVLKNVSEAFPTAMLESFQETLATFKIVQTNVSTFEPYVNIFYKGLEMNKDKYFENLIQVMSIKAENDLKKFQNIPPFHLWPIGDYSVDDVKVTTVQEAGKAKRYLSIPFGALQQPFIGNDIPVFDMAGFGFYLAAFYMMHFTIDDLLVLYEKNREVEEPETSVAAEKQMEVELIPRIECMFDDFRRISAHLRLEPKMDPTFYAFGRIKNIAYVAATELLLETLVRNSNLTYTSSKNQILLGFEKYSPDQLFYLAMARHTCKTVTPERKVGMGKRGSIILPFLVDAAFRNSEHFAKTWSCSPRRFMNSRRKCKFFMKPPSAPPRPTKSK